MEDNTGLLSENIVYCTALYLAAQNGHRDVVKYISELPIKPIANHSFKFTAFYFAAQNGHVDVLKYFTPNGVAFVDENITSSSTANTTTNESDKIAPSNNIVEVQHSSTVISDANVQQNKTTKSIENNQLFHKSIKFTSDAQAGCSNAANVKAIDDNITDSLESVEEICSDIFEAAKKGAEKQLNGFVTKGVDVNISNGNGNTPLHIACSEGNIRSIEFLFKNDADLKAKNKMGNTPIHLASEKGHTKVVEQFLKKGIFVDIKNPVGDTPIHLAAKNGHLDLLELLLRKNSNMRELNKNGDSAVKLAINYAVENACAPIINMLCKQGFNNEFQEFDEKGETYLHKAIRKNQINMVECFLQASSALIEYRTQNSNETPLFIASALGYTAIVELLLKNKADANPSKECSLLGVSWLYKSLHIAAHNGHHKVVEVFLECGMEVDCVAEGAIYFSYITPLEIAAIQGHIKTVQLLLIYNTNIKLLNSRYLQYCKNEEILNLLRSY